MFKIKTIITGILISVFMTVPVMAQEQNTDAMRITYTQLVRDKMKDPEALLIKELYVIDSSNREFINAFYNYGNKIDNSFFKTHRLTMGKRWAREVATNLENGGKIIVARSNGKNGFGAYVGYTWDCFNINVPQVNSITCNSAIGPAAIITGTDINEGHHD